MKRSMWNRLKRVKYATFFRQILVVMISVSLSMAVGRWIDQRKRESNIKVSLGLVRDELRENRAYADSVVVTLRHNQNGFRFLSDHRHAIRQLDGDTLTNYMQLALWARRGMMNHYAMEVLKNSATYEELDNALLIYLSRMYGVCTMYSETARRFFEQSQQVYDESITRLYDTHQPSADEVFDVLMGIRVFRARLYNPSLVESMLAVSSAVSAELDQCIVLMDSILKNDGYKNFKIPPTVDYLGAL